MELVMKVTKTWGKLKNKKAGRLDVVNTTQTLCLSQEGWPCCMFHWGNIPTKSGKPKLEELA